MLVSLQSGIIPAAQAQLRRRDRTTRTAGSRWPVNGHTHKRGDRRWCSLPTRDPWCGEPCTCGEKKRELRKERKEKKTRMGNTRVSLLCIYGFSEAFVGNASVFFSEISEGFFFFFPVDRHNGERGWTGRTIPASFESFVRRTPCA